MPHWEFVLGIYAGVALATLGFQTWMRLDDYFSGPRPVSLARGAVWSAIWPACWLLLFWGWLKSAEA